MGPELQERYRGHFLPYLNRRIAQLEREASRKAAQDLDTGPRIR